MPLISPAARRFLKAARVAHMATVDESGAPTVLPICFQVKGRYLYSVIDEKPKRAAPMALRRVRDLLAQPRLAVVVDHYEEDWRRLGWVLLRGEAELLTPGNAHGEALALLRAKYPQYREMNLAQRPIIRMRILSLRSWGDLTPRGSD
ncbi:MAG: TIGR03668 family PPOX class F420-dependent oxidoreductase [SAR324 cluster bacterium]|nr:TIGR03668 family PPOX class F420-dependent oxidoreductase [SAR324 cluster bacterium]